MKTRLYFCGAPYEISDDMESGTLEKFEKTGRNTGNLLIGYGLRSILKSNHCRTWNGLDTPDWIREHFDALVIPAANFIFRSFDFGYLANLIEKVDLPVLVAGLGAQASRDGFDIKQIPEGTIRFVKAAAERCNSIAVRGAFSAEVISEMGVKEIRVLGCPSLVTHGDTQLPLRHTPTKEKLKICINGSRNVTGHSFDPISARRIERDILEYGIRNQCSYVYQNEFPELLISNGETPIDAAAQLTSIITSLSLDQTVAELHNYIASHGAAFYSVPAWMQWISQFDFVVGTRFHGNMIAALAGVPSMVITHDSRTAEMCETISFPSVSVSDLDSFDPEKLIEMVDIPRFQKRYSQIRKGFADFIVENGFEHLII